MSKKKKKKIVVIADPTLDEFKAITAMLKRARPEGLEVEVIWSFANEIRAGNHDYLSASASACYEWDL